LCEVFNSRLGYDCTCRAIACKTKRPTLKLKTCAKTFYIGVYLQSNICGIFSSNLIEAITFSITTLIIMGLFAALSTNDTQHVNSMLNVIMLCVVFFITLLLVIILSMFMLCFFMLNDIMLSVVTPFNFPYTFPSSSFFL
jgi:hypothetical protein